MTAFLQAALNELQHAVGEVKQLVELGRYDDARDELNDVEILVEVVKERIPEGE